MKQFHGTMFIIFSVISCISAFYLPQVKDTYLNIVGPVFGAAMYFAGFYLAKYQHARQEQQFLDWADRAEKILKGMGDNK